MRVGEFEAAWRVSDAVLAGRDPATRDDPALSYHQRWVWDGRPLDGRPALVRCYHGLGDTLQFCRYLPALRARVPELTLEAQPELLPLLRTLPGPDRLAPFSPDAPLPLPEAGCDIEIMELAHALRELPAGAPYLTAEPFPRPPADADLLVGLCWQAGGWDPGRSLPLAALAELGRVPGVQLVSLQRGPAAADLASDGAPTLLDRQDDSTDVMVAARWIMTLDLVVTVDSMVAHLAGALGRPTWLLLQAEADWRWMSGRADSPWYDSVRLYRQTTPGCWANPVAQVHADLCDLAAGNACGNPGAARGL